MQEKPAPLASVSLTRGERGIAAPGLSRALWHFGGAATPREGFCSGLSFFLFFFFYEKC